MSFTIKHNIPTKKLIKECDIRKFLKKMYSIYNLILIFIMNGLMVFMKINM
jgi:hypothetical protein